MQLQVLRSAKGSPKEIKDSPKVPKDSPAKVPKDSPAKVPKDSPAKVRWPGGTKGGGGTCLFL